MLNSEAPGCRVRRYDMAAGAHAGLKSEPMIGLVSRRSFSRACGADADTGFPASLGLQRSKHDACQANGLPCAIRHDLQRLGKCPCRSQGVGRARVLQGLPLQGDSFEERPPGNLMSP